MPAAQASEVSGTAPTPATTTSASMTVPSASVIVTPEAVSASPVTPVPQRMSTPLWTCRPAMTAATRAGTPRPISRGPSSTTVTRPPSAAAEAASSSPMNPPPITATRRPGASLARSAAESAWLRSTWTWAPPKGSRRARAPVASRSER